MRPAALRHGEDRSTFAALPGYKMMETPAEAGAGEEERVVFTGGI